MFGWASAPALPRFKKAVADQHAHTIRFGLFRARKSTFFCGFLRTAVATEDGTNLRDHGNNVNKPYVRFQLRTIRVGF